MSVELATRVVRLRRIPLRATAAGATVNLAATRQAEDHLLFREDIGIRELATPRTRGLPKNRWRGSVFVRWPKRGESRYVPYQFALSRLICRAEGRFLVKP